MNAAGFLAAPPLTDEALRMFDEDIADTGHVMNNSRLWAHRPRLAAGLSELLGEAGAAAGLDFRARGVLIAACASAAGDSYCALAWAPGWRRRATRTRPPPCSAVPTPG